MTVAYAISNAPSVPILCKTNGLQVKSCRSNIFNNHKEATQMIGNALSPLGDVMMMMRLRKGILTFRDAIRLPPSDMSLKELLIETVVNLHKRYPNVVPQPSISEMDKTSTDQGLVEFYTALCCMRDSWLKHNKLDAEELYDSRNLEDTDLEQLGEKVQVMLDHTRKNARTMINTIAADENSTRSKEKRRRSAEFLDSLHLDSVSTCSSVPRKRPRLEAVESVTETTPPSLSPPNKESDHEMDEPLEGKTDDYCITENESKTPSEISSVMLGVRPAPLVNTSQTNSAAVQSSATCLSIEAEMRPTPPPPPPFPQNATSPAPPPPPPPPTATIKGAAPPPPPPAGAKALVSPLKAKTKLKRSTKLGNLYRKLKRTLDGSNNVAKKSEGKKFRAKASNGSKEGMGDALAEMMQRSSYFQQIEKDVEDHGSKIMEIKSAIIAFQNKDMQELIKFHEYIEETLERLTDETQVLAKFEGFPQAKLECLRTAAALYTKLDGMITILKDWKIVAPLDQLLGKVENYFNKIKVELDEIERHKEDDTKRFQSENIHFNFQMVQQIKELVVDVSSGCMELALKEKRKASASSGHGSKTDSEKKASVKTLWRAFQLAFRVYMFAGGLDDNAERLTSELAEVIEADSQV